MNDQHLKDCKFMSELIKTTESALHNMVILKKKCLEKPSVGEVMMKDACYNLHIGEYKDGSGVHADLDRYVGNEQLLDVIIETLDKQLKSYKSQYADM